MCIGIMSIGENRSAVYAVFRIGYLSLRLVSCQDIDSVENDRILHFIRKGRGKRAVCIEAEKALRGEADPVQEE